jgi:hypothetical protein
MSIRSMPDPAGRAAHPWPATRVPWALAAGTAAAFAADLAFDPARRHLPLCPFHALTGWWCPLCGGLRSAYSLAHGRLGAAVQDNALFAAAVPVLLVLWLAWVTGGPTQSPRLRALRAAPGRRVLIALAITACTLFTVLRNLPTMSGLRPI